MKTIQTLLSSAVVTLICFSQSFADVGIKTIVHNDTGLKYSYIVNELDCVKKDNTRHWIDPGASHELYPKFSGGCDGTGSYKINLYDNKKTPIGFAKPVTSKNQYSISYDLFSSTKAVSLSGDCKQDDTNQGYGQCDVYLTKK